MSRFSRAVMIGSAVAAVMAPVAALPTLAQAQTVSGAHMSHHQPSLNLSAFGEVRVAPDQATINFGVVTEAATAQEAMQANARRMEQVMQALRRAGIAERDIQTSGLNLSAQYHYQENQPPRIRGYEATNRVTVLVRDVAKTGTTADAVVSAGVNQIDGITFGLSNPGAAEDQARRLAVQALQAKAAVYAEALGKPVGTLRSLTESGGYVPQPHPGVMYARAAMAQDASTSVSGGELAVRIDISGVYDMH